MTGAVAADKAKELKRQRRLRERELQRPVRGRSEKATNDVAPGPPSSPPASDETNRKAKIKESDITGLKYVDKLAPPLKRLHVDGC